MKFINNFVQKAFEILQKHSYYGLSNTVFTCPFCTNIVKTTIEKYIKKLWNKKWLNTEYEWECKQQIPGVQVKNADFF